MGVQLGRVVEDELAAAFELSRAEVRRRFRAWLQRRACWVLHSSDFQCVVVRYEWVWRCPHCGWIHETRGP